MNRPLYQGRPLYFLLAVLLCWSGTRGGIWLWSVPRTEANVISTASSTEAPPKFAIAAPFLPVNSQRPRVDRHSVDGHSVDGRRVGWPNMGRDGVRAAPVAIVVEQHNGINDRVDQRTTTSQAATMSRASRHLMRTLQPVEAMTRSHHAIEPPVGGAQAAILSKGRPSGERQLLLTEPAKSNPWSLSAWMLWRQDGTRTRRPDGGSIPLYGASQVGARLAYRFQTVRPVELYARASAPLRLKEGKEIAIGGAILPFKRANIAVAVEQRFRLDGENRSAPAVLVYGGFGPKTIGPIEAEGYAQTGMVGFRDPNLFADGALVARKQVTRLGDAPLYVGAGIWGGAQRGASRVDIGPRIGVDVPMKDGPNLRFAVDWRQRVAGPAHPASGLALSLGTDF